MTALIIISWVNGPMAGVSSVTFHEFNNPAICESVAHDIMRRVGEWQWGGKRSILAFCAAGGQS